MRTALRVLFYLMAAEVLVQGMAIACGCAVLGRWIDDGHSATKALFEDDNAKFGGSAGFGIQFINGIMVIPGAVLRTPILSLFSGVPAATRNAAVLLGLVIVQVGLGLSSHSLPGLILLHVL